MYIADVIENAKRLYTSEYTVKEYIDWCDELSADIRRNYNVSYDSVKAHGSKVLLPEDVEINDISKIIMDGRELKKTDLRDFGIEYEYSETGKVLKKNDGTVCDFEIIYALPHIPIRYIDEDVEVIFEQGSFTIKNQYSDVFFVPGDNVIVTDGEQRYKALIWDIETDNKYIYRGSSIPVGERTVHMFREFDERTLIPAPYDTAYMDFVNSKVALYQGDTDAYSSFMGQFNVKMNDYRKYLTRNMPRSEAKFINWL